MTLEALVEEIRMLPVAERKQLVMHILDSLSEDQTSRTRSILEFEGIGVRLRDEDPQEYINRLREEWDDRP